MVLPLDNKTVISSFSSRDAAQNVFFGTTIPLDTPHIL
jgi:hypothetical protein